jgi:hypothetical protein
MILIGLGLLLLVSMVNAAEQINASWNSVTGNNAYASSPGYVLLNGATNLSYNISVCANGTENITQLNITLPVGISFTTGTNWTNATGTSFASVDAARDILTWNATSMIPVGACRNFGFNSNVSSTVINVTFEVTGFNATATYFNLTAWVDIASPSITINSPASGAQIHGLSNDVTYTATDDFSVLMLCTTTYDGLGSVNFTLNNTALTNTYTFPSYGSQRCLTVSCIDAIGHTGTSASVCVFPLRAANQGYPVVTGCGSTDANTNYGNNAYPACCPSNLPKFDGTTCVTGQSTVQVQSGQMAAVTVTTLASGTTSRTGGNLGILVILVLAMGACAYYIERK